jgi:putative SOS response-associated peptidase YedK
MPSPSDRRTRLIPFSGFARPSEGTLPPIIRFVLSLSQVEFSAFAGLCDLSRTDAGERVESVTHITVPANPLLGVILRSD